MAREVEAYEYLAITSSEESAKGFQNCVDIVDHRCQTLHHAATLGVRKAIYIVASWKRIIRAVVLDFDDSEGYEGNMDRIPMDV